MTHVLMVCMGNICRSPMAQAVLQKMAADAGRANIKVIRPAPMQAIVAIGQMPGLRLHFDCVAIQQHACGHAR